MIWGFSSRALGQAPVTITSDSSGARHLGSTLQTVFEYKFIYTFA